MAQIGNYAMPIAIGAIVLFGLFRGVDVFDCFLEGAKNGLHAAIRILPSLVALLTAVSMLRASGALDALVYALAPVGKVLGIPDDVMPLALLRPVSGSGSLALLEQIFDKTGPDSLPGRVASVMMGSTETTFYAVSVYYGAVGIKKTRQTIPAALVADFAGVVFSALVVGWMFR